MWASDMLYLNDATEIFYGRRLIGEALFGMLFGERPTERRLSRLGRGMFIRAFEQTLARDADFKLGLQIELPDITVVVRPEDFSLRKIRSQGGHHERDASGPHS